MGNIVKFHGRLKWVQKDRPDKYGKWSLQFYPLDKETKAAIKGLGTRAKPKLDDNDEQYYSFSRKVKAAWGDLEAPYVLDKDGNPTTVKIANDSEGWVVLDVYEYRGGTDAAGNPYDGGKAVRWEGLEMTKLIEYTPQAANAAPAPAQPIEAPF